MARTIGAALGLLAFAVSLIAGLVVQNSIERILARALLASVIFVIIGMLVGGAIDLVLAEYVAHRTRESSASPGPSPTGGAVQPSRTEGAKEGEPKGMA